jgi:hypothetical protein
MALLNDSWGLLCTVLAALAMSVPESGLMIGFASELKTSCALTFLTIWIDDS